MKNKIDKDKLVNDLMKLVSNNPLNELPPLIEVDGFLRTQHT
jgi:hypothetical protein